MVYVFMYPAISPSDDGEMEAMIAMVWIESGILC